MQQPCRVAKRPRQRILRHNRKPDFRRDDNCRRLAFPKRGEERAAVAGKIGAFTAMLRVLTEALPHWRDDFRPVVASLPRHFSATSLGRVR